MKKIEHSIALVTGANRGIGKAIVEELLARGASKVYAGVRNTDSTKSLVAQYGNRVVPLELDVTNKGHIAAAASAAPDVQILVNNAGIVSGMGRSITENEQGFRDELEVNVFGPLAMATAFRSAIESTRGVIVNLNTVGSLVSFPMAPSYSASKAASHSITQALRLELGPKGVSVIGVYPGPVDTDMAAEITWPKETPQQVAREILDAVESGVDDVFPDDMARDIQRQYGEEPKKLELSMATMAAAG